MATDTVLIPHGLSEEEAIARLEGLIAGAEPMDYLEAVSFERDTTGYRFVGKVQGISVTGDVVIEAAVVKVRYRVPWAAQPLRKRTSGYIEDYLQQALAPRT